MDETGLPDRRGQVVADMATVQLNKSPGQGDLLLVLQAHANQHGAQVIGQPIRVRRWIAIQGGSPAEPVSRPLRYGRRESAGDVPALSPELPVEGQRFNQRPSCQLADTPRGDQGYDPAHRARDVAMCMERTG